MSFDSALQTIYGAVVVDKLIYALQLLDRI